MKARLRLKGKIRSKKQRSAVSYQPSALGNSLSTMSIQQSALSSWQLVKYWALDKARSLRSFLQLILFFVSCSAALAQESAVHATPAGQAETEMTSLKIGDKIPDELWEMSFPVVSANSDEVQYLSLGDYKDKLIILDFWATWCSPCVAMIPKMDSLQNVFGDKIQFLSVTYQKKQEVLPFLAKLEQVKERQYQLPVLAGDNYLRFVFPHNQLPHYVWVENGVVKSITGYEEVNEDNIHTLIRREEANLKTKVDDERIPYDRNKLLFMDGNGGNGGAIRYHSVLAGYTRGLGAEYNFKRDSVNGDKVTIINSPIYDLYSTAFGGRELKYRNLNRLIFEIDEVDKFLLKNEENYKTWINENGYSYEIKVPKQLNSSLYKTMQMDLDRLFPQYEAAVEKRTITCLVLTRTSEIDKLKSESANPVYKKSSVGLSMKKVMLRPFIQDLSLFFLQGSPFPIIDETDYSDVVDMEIIANLSNVSSLNKALEKYDLKIIEAEREIDMLVIKDRVIDSLTLQSN